MYVILPHSLVNDLNKSSEKTLNPVSQDDVIKWKHFPGCWPFVRGIHRSPVNSPSQRPVTRSFDVFFDLRLNKRLSKQSWECWFGTPLRSWWRRPNGCIHVGMKRTLWAIAIYGLLWRPILTHWGRVTHYGDGSMLCKSPTFFTVK